MQGGSRRTGDSSYVDEEPNSENNSLLNPTDGRSSSTQNHNWWSVGESTSSDQINPIGSSKTDYPHGSHTRPFFLRGSSSNHGKDMDINGRSDLQTSGIVIREGSSSQTVDERNSGLFGGGGSSCKRKSFEGSPSQPFSGSPGYFYQTESHHAQYDSSSSLSLSTPNVNNQSDHLEPRLGLGGGGIVVSESVFPSTRTTETLSRPGRRLNTTQPQDSVAFIFSQQNLPAASSPFVDSSSSESSQPSMIHLPALTRNIHQFAWNTSSSSRTNNIPGEGFGPPLPEQQPVFTTTPVNEEQFHWSFTRGSSSNTTTPSPFATRGGGSSSGSNNNPTWGTPRIPEVTPSWSLFPSIESDTVTAHVGASSSSSIPFLLPTASSVEASAVPPSGGGSSSSSRSSGHRHRQRRSGLLLERQSDMLHLRHLGRSLTTDNDGRNRLLSEIRQVLSAMRRGENLRLEDYMVFDPMIYQSMAEMHDRHRDMRLDVDNMSYEELLELGERIGDVSTGLTEEVIMKAMKQHKHTPSPATESHQDMEPCCVCQEEYVEGDDLGTLGCGHEFHSACVKQWLLLKNLCPICKTVALST